MVKSPVLIGQLLVKTVDFTVWFDVGLKINSDGDLYIVQLIYTSKTLYVM